MSPLDWFEDITVTEQDQALDVLADVLRDEMPLGSLDFITAALDERADDAIYHGHIKAGQAASALAGKLRSGR